MQVLKRCRKFLFGSSLRMRDAANERFTNAQALAVLSSDAQSSVAYSTEEILLALLILGQAAFLVALPIAIAIIVLLAIVINSYMQTVVAYPQNGGCYIVAKDNLGTTASLVAGASLLIDYVLTVSVSAAAAVAALHSAFPDVYAYRLLIGVSIIAVLAYLNMRGVRAAGTLFTIPTMVFTGSMFVLIIVAFVRYFTDADVGKVVQVTRATAENLTWFLVLKGFASGCTAMTGVEAISDGVGTLHEPTGKNGRKVLIWLGFILGSIFLGLSFAAYLYNVLPDIRGHETVVSQIAKRVFENTSFSFMYYAVQIMTGLILVLACNTSFQDYPRLSFFLARDGFLPNRFKNVGDKLVYSFGILTLALLSSTVLILSGGHVHSIIPFYALGVFLSFTLSQLGMVIYWQRRRTAPKSKFRMIVNGVGAFATGVVMMVVLITKSDAHALFVLIPTAILFFALKRAALRFLVMIAGIGTLAFFHINPGASLIVIFIILLVKLFSSVQRHYEAHKRLLDLRGKTLPPKGSKLKHTVIVPVGDVDMQALVAMQHARSESPARIFAVHIATDQESADAMKKKWIELVPDASECPLEVVIEERPQQHNIMEAIISFISRIDKLHDDDTLTVVIPYLVPKNWFEGLLHNRTSKRLLQYIEESPMDIGIEMVMVHPH